MRKKKGMVAERRELGKLSPSLTSLKDVRGPKSFKGTGKNHTRSGPKTKEKGVLDGEPNSDNQEKFIVQKKGDEGG